jgi:asparagine synthase (glutamine-hydrolysing)
MCGLIGYYSNQQPITQDRIKNALYLMRHRGPETSHHWESQNGLIALGHNRLSLIGIDNGLQPIFSEDKSVVIVVNGEFYNYKTIKRNLEKKGHLFHTETDSEILIPLYREYGVKCLDHLNGEFAFILWDNKNKLFFAARDRFGIKPLFYSQYKDAFLFASEIKAILAMGAPAQWNDIAFLNFSSGLPNQKTTLFKGINLVKPGHHILIKNGQLCETSYWRFTPKNHSSITYNEAVEKFRFLLEQAVLRRLTADVPVGCYLSGGIDSASILSLATKHKKDMHAFTIGFDEPEYDESQYAETLAKHLNIKLSILKITQQDLASHYKDAIYYRESLVYQTSGVGKFLLSRHAQNHGIKAVITGEGADEILAGYPSFKEDYLMNCLSNNNCGHLFKKLLNENKQISSAYVSCNEYPELLNIQNCLGYTPSFLKLSCEISRVTRQILSNRYLHAPPENHCPFNAFLSEINQQMMKGLGFVEKSQYLWSISFFPELILSYLGDRMEMAHSIEGRLPFLDAELVTFVNSLPINFKINNALTGKILLRDAMKNLVPETIRTRKKHIFSAPTISKHRHDKNAMLNLMQQVFTDHSFKKMGTHKQEKVLRLLNALPNMKKRTKMITEFALHAALSTYFLRASYNV